MGENLKTFSAGLTPGLRVNPRGEGHGRGSQQQEQQENPSQQGKKNKKKKDVFVAKPRSAFSGKSGQNPQDNLEKKAVQDFDKLLKGKHDN